MLAFQVTLRAVFAVVFLQDCLVVKKPQLRRSSDHVEIDDPFHLGVYRGELRSAAARRGAVMIDDHGSCCSRIHGKLIGSTTSLPFPLCNHAENADGWHFEDRDKT